MVAWSEDQQYIILSVNSGSTHLALIGVKLQTNIIITSAFDVKPDEL